MSSKSFVDIVLSSIEKKHMIAIPTCYLQDKSIKLLDDAIESLNFVKIQNVFNQIANDFNYAPLDLIESAVKERVNVNETDKKIISVLAKRKNHNFNIILNLSGNFYFVTKLMEEMEKNDDFLKNQKVIDISLRLYLFLQIIEIISAYVGYLVLPIVNSEETQDTKKIKDYLKKFDDNKHPTLFHSFEILKQYNLIEDYDKSTFKGIASRNAIAHANLYYDDLRDLIFTSNGENISTENFKNELQSLLGFLGELMEELKGELSI